MMMYTKFFDDNDEIYFFHVGNFFVKIIAIHLVIENRKQNFFFLVCFTRSYRIAEISISDNINGYHDKFLNMKKNNFNFQ